MLRHALAVNVTLALIDRAVDLYLDGGLIEDCLNLSTPPITTYKFYKRLEERGEQQRGRISRKEMKLEGTLFCKMCLQDKELVAFSKHPGSKNGYDCSACKSCKKSKVDWSKVPLEKKIFNRIKARAKEKGIPFDLTLEDIIIPEMCPVFNKPFIYGDHKWTPSVDRFIPELGYVKGNIAIISNFANMLKGEATCEDLEKLLTWIKSAKLVVK